MRNKFTTLVAAFAVVAGLVAVSTPAQAADPQALAGKGSSFAFNMLDNCKGSYTTNTATYTSTGSGTGRTEYQAGNIQWAASDAALTAATDSTKSNAGSYVNVPLLGGPIVFAYSAVGVGDGLQLTPQIVSGIFKGTITMWNADEIKAVNSKIKLPKKPIKIAYRAAGSGTTQNLTNWLKQSVPASWASVPAGGTNDLNIALGGSATTKTGTVYDKASLMPASAQTFATSALLSAQIEDNSNWFGYFDLSDALTADVGIAKLQNAAGAFVAPTAAAAAKFLNAQSPITADGPTNGTLSIDFTKVVPGAYQLSILTYGIAPKFTGTGKSSDAKKLAVQDWFNYLVKTCVPAKAATLGYVALGGALKTSALNQIKTIG